MTESKYSELLARLEPSESATKATLTDAYNSLLALESQLEETKEEYQAFLEQPAKAYKTIGEQREIMSEATAVIERSEATIRNLEAEIITQKESVEMAKMHHANAISTLKKRKEQLELAAEWNSLLEPLMALGLKMVDAGLYPDLPSVYQFQENRFLAPDSYQHLKTVGADKIVDKIANYKRKF